MENKVAATTRIRRQEYNEEQKQQLQLLGKCVENPFLMVQRFKETVHSFGVLMEELFDLGNHHHHQFIYFVMLFK